MAKVCDFVAGVESEVVFGAVEAVETLRGMLEFVFDF